MPAGYPNSSRNLLSNGTLAPSSCPQVAWGSRKSDGSAPGMPALRQADPAGGAPKPASPDPQAERRQGRAGGAASSDLPQRDPRLAERGGTGARLCQYRGPANASAPGAVHPLGRETTARFPLENPRRAAQALTTDSSRHHHFMNKAKPASVSQRFHVGIASVPDR